jgi:hypothetical protein
MSPATSKTKIKRNSKNTFSFKNATRSEYQTKDAFPSNKSSKFSSPMVPCPSFFAETCVICYSDIEKNSVLFACDCIVVYCQSCAPYQVASQAETYNSGLICPYCRKKSDTIRNVDQCRTAELELIESAINHYKLRTSRNDNGIKKTVLLMYAEGYVGTMSIKDVESIDNESNASPPVRLELARLETLRRMKLNGDVTYGTNSLPLGPLSKLSFTRNMVLERGLEIQKSLKFFLRDEIGNQRNILRSYGKEYFPSSTSSTKVQEENEIYHYYDYSKTEKLNRNNRDSKKNSNKKSHLLLDQNNVDNNNNSLNQVKRASKGNNIRNSNDLNENSNSNNKDDSKTSQKKNTSPNRLRSKNHPKSIQQIAKEQGANKEQELDSTPIDFTVSSSSQQNQFKKLDQRLYLDAKEAINEYTKSSMKMEEGSRCLKLNPDNNTSDVAGPYGRALLRPRKKSRLSNVMLGIEHGDTVHVTSGRFVKTIGTFIGPVDNDGTCEIECMNDDGSYYSIAVMIDELSKLEYPHRAGITSAMAKRKEKLGLDITTSIVDTSPTTISDDNETVGCKRSISPNDTDENDKHEWDGKSNDDAPSVIPLASVVEATSIPFVIPKPIEIISVDDNPCPSHVPPTIINGLNVNAPSKVYCLCEKPFSGHYITCHSTSKLCNGLVHPGCCSDLKILSANDLNRIDVGGHYICPKCISCDDGSPPYFKHMSLLQGDAQAKSIFKHNKILKQAKNFDPFDRKASLNKSNGELPQNQLNDSIINSPVSLPGDTSSHDTSHELLPYDCCIDLTTPLIPFKPPQANGISEVASGGACYRISLYSNGSTILFIRE